MPDELSELAAQVAALEARIAALEKDAKPPQFGQTEAEARAVPYVRD